jgi:hypothetical protein
VVGLNIFIIKIKIVNIFTGFVLIKIRVSRGIGQFSLGFGSYSLYALTYDPYELRWVITISKR